MVLERRSDLIIHEFNQLKTEFFLTEFLRLRMVLRSMIFWRKIRKPVENIIFDRISAVKK